MRKTKLFLLLAAVLACLLAGHLVLSSAAVTVKLGDVNRDGNITAKDYILVKRAALQTVRLTADQRKIADVSGDGNINAKDYVLVKRAALHTYTITKTVEVESSGTAPSVTVRKADWANVKWENYSSLNFTLKIPRGWKVEWKGDANQMAWMATSPDGKIGIFNLDHCYAAKDPSMAATLGFSYSMTGGTVQEFFKQLFADSTDYFTPQNAIVPDNYELLQSVRPYTPIRDYKAIYATFKDSTVGKGEGIYSAVVMDSKDVIVSGRNYGAWEVNCIVYSWAPLGELVNWNPVIATIAKSFAYTDYYLQQWWYIAGTTGEPTTNNDTDPILEAFEERDKADTILNEKRSDMIGEYERVYDNERGEIYRAYNGFLDDMGDQTRYTAITDSQYADGFVGWIDKD